MNEFEAASQSVVFVAKMTSTQNRGRPRALPAWTCAWTSRRMASEASGSSGAVASAKSDACCINKIYSQ